MNKNIQILISTYNGNSYISSQFNSLMAQSYGDFYIIARDDGSLDQSLVFLKQNANHVLEDSLGNLKPCQSFGQLLIASNADYVFCCDQDDIWQPQKVELMLQKMQHLESIHGVQTPILVHHDLEVVNENLETIAASMWSWRGLDVVKGAKLNRLVLQNVVTGCAMLVNRALLNKALPLPKEAAMHDWWLALVAAAFGVIEAVPVSLVRYRQHSQNSLGAKQFSAIQVLKTLLGKVELKPSIQVRLLQAQVFSKRYEEQLSSEQLEMLLAFAHLHEYSWLERRKKILKYDFQLNGFLKNLAWWFFV
jgi:glycosyltransferase involved in cell wall biosynthesis